MTQIRKLCLFVAFLLMIPLSLFAQGDPAYVGKWEMLPAQSTDIDLWGTLSVEFRSVGTTVGLVEQWGGARNFRDSLVLRTGGAVNAVPIRNRVFPSNVFMGLMMPVGSTREIVAEWQENGTGFTWEEKFPVRGSQGVTPAIARHSYSLSADKELLTYTIHRSTRTSGPDVRYIFKRAGAKQAFFYTLEDNWEMGGKLSTNAFLISLQGVVNKNGPMVYILYPENWPFTYVRSVFDFYKTKKNFTYRELRSAGEALSALRQYVKGYVVWDKNVRTSLIVAFTAAGLENAVVVSEDQLPIMEKAGLKMVEDLRGRFTGQNDAQIYTWAYNKYWSRCSKDVIVWLGGEHGTVMKPAVADWGMFKGVFFNDLSCRTTDSAEYALASRLLKEMKPMSMVMGWHSYGKDLEREFVKLTSTYGHRVEGLHTLPNLSFSAQVPPSKGFVFKNNHSLVPGKDYTPGKKVYISCIQTDGVGLGAWLEPGRGEIPYAWEVLMNYTWMAPAMAEYFYTMATPNDYFIGCLSGPGYMYPKVIPPKMFPQLMAMAREQMKTLDLRVFETMDYSEGATVEGNTDLTKQIVDAYYAGMPDAIGFVNGYAPSYTYTVRDGKPFISYDYYLSPERPEADAVADLQELARINAKRPYFLLVHVREASNVKRVKGILDKLPSEFELVPLDIFLTLAGKNPTYQERFREK
jgi:hypothetical protein